MDQDQPLAEVTQPTERFMEQHCPWCGTRNVVALFLTEDSCTNCERVFEVAPLAPL